MARVLRPGAGLKGASGPGPSDKDCRDALEGVNEVSYVIDAEGRVTCVSPAFKGLTDHGPREVRGRPLTEFVHPDDLTRAREVFGEMASLRPRTAEFRMTTKAGDALWVRASSRPVIRDGRVVGLRGVLMDVTGRKLLEDRILAACAHEQRRIGKALHDGLGQELAGIAYLCKSLEQRLGPKCPDEAAAAAEITGLVNDAMVHGREIAKMLDPVRPEPGGLAQALGEMASRISVTYRVSCVFRPSGKVAVNDSGTATHAFRVAQEAVSNAMKHGNPRRITIELGAGNGTVTLIVRDDGVGLAEGWREAGGMGLRMMGDRARIIGGRLSVERAPEGGTVVTCRFPAGTPPRRGGATR
jgi:PAS domain S-box-containing protein